MFRRYAPLAVLVAVLVAFTVLMLPLLGVVRCVVIEIAVVVAAWFLARAGAAELDRRDPKSRP